MPRDEFEDFLTVEQEKPALARGRSG